MEVKFSPTVSTDNHIHTFTAAVIPASTNLLNKIELDTAVNRGLAFLQTKQEKNGGWMEYKNRARIGPATAWPTAMTAYFLGQCEEANLLTSRACEYLITRERKSGWGYNHIAACDLDSTAWTALALHGNEIVNKNYHQIIGKKILAYSLGTDMLFLFRSNLRTRIMGWSSFNWSIKGWMGPHLEVTALSIAALGSLGVLRSEHIRFLKNHLNVSNPTVLQHSYWWDDDYYLLSVLWLASEFVSIPIDLIRPLEEKLLPNINCNEISSFTASFLLYSSARIGKYLPQQTELRKLIIESQAEDGSWKSAPNLRVPGGRSTEPWLRNTWKKDRPGPWALWSQSEHIPSTSVAIAALSKQYIL